MTCNDFSRVRGPGGFTLTEVVVATLVLGGIITMSIPVLGQAAEQARAAERRFLATQALSNVLRDWSKSTETAEAADLRQSFPQAVLERLPDAEWRFEVETIENPQPGSRCIGQISWRGRGGERMRPVRLVAYRFASQGT